MQIQIQMKMVMQKQKQKQKQEQIQIQMKTKMQTQTKITNADKNATPKWVSKCDSKGTEIKCYGIQWKQRASLSGSQNTQIA